ncbi:hypothetical protein KL86CLO1_10472 [uncultured Eubacteriales bacterium]|uniref:Uncharacterized protein n=1 Tax=uncultured Eubacteriales bacterium TaxID=172733 RepID=A0A212J3W7_9FIRM|nr:hypothetical protein KL86CLO1_10472 [uncultured Eubacteriales bacterium]
MENDRAQSAEEIVRGLRCWGGLTTPCKSESGDCYYIAHGWPVHCRETACNDAADLIETQAAEITELQDQLGACGQQIGLMTSDYENQLRILKAQLTASQQRERAARNELCLKCGRYHEAHKSACDGCRWTKGE